MGAELLRGQNHPLPGAGLEIQLTAAVPVVAGAILDGVPEGARSGGAPAVRLAHPGAPVLPGVPGVRTADRAAAAPRITVDLAALDAAAPVPEGPDRLRLTVVIALPEPAVDRAPGATSFGALDAPRATVSAADGTLLAAFTLTGLGPETAVAALELYRRQGGWRVRAFGQGYAGGLAEMFADYRLPGAAEAAAEVHAAVRRRAVPAQRSAEPPALADRPDPGDPVAGDAPGWTMEERLYNQVEGMFEDLARRIAGYRSAVEFADSRLERELDALLADPATRTGPAAEAARDRAQARRDELVDHARAGLDHDLRQLTAESQVIEPALPPPYAGWESPVWHGYREPMLPPMAVRLGDIHLPEVPELRIPLLVRLPLAHGLWIDSGTGGYGGGWLDAESGGVTAAEAEQVRRRSAEVAASLAVRLLAAHPVGGLTVHLVDPVGSVTAAFAPLARSGALREWQGTGAADGVQGALEAMTRRVDLVRMAAQAGAPEALPPDLDTGTQLLVVSGFPYGFDDRAVTRLRYLADEGPEAGVHLVMVADRADAQEFGPLLDPLWRSLRRLTPLPDDHLADPWVGQVWTYEPSLPPEGSEVIGQVLGRIAEARQAHGS